MGMKSNSVDAKEIVRQMMLHGSTKIEGVTNDRDAKNIKINLLKQWQKLRREFAAIDGQPDAEAEKLTVGYKETDTAGVYIFELRTKQSGGVVSRRFYQVISNESTENHVA
jgi:hypothetical protein